MVSFFDSMYDQYFTSIPLLQRDFPLLSVFSWVLTESGRDLINIYVYASPVLGFQHQHFSSLRIIPVRKPRQTKYCPLSIRDRGSLRKERMGHLILQSQSTSPMSHAFCRHLIPGLKTLCSLESKVVCRVHRPG